MEEGLLVLYTGRQSANPLTSYKFQYENIAGHVCFMIKKQNY